MSAAPDFALGSALGAATSTATLARNALSPLLEQLIQQLGEEGRATERACFYRIKRTLDQAQDDTMLAESILALSTTTVVGFAQSVASQPLLDRIVEKAAAVTDRLQQCPVVIH